MKRKTINIPADAVIGLLLGATPRCIRKYEPQGVPIDAKFIGIWFDPQSDSFDIVVEHESFPDCLPGMRYPRCEVIVTTQIIGE